MPHWDRFKELCHLQFGPLVRGSRLAELGRLQFTSTVQDYADRFNMVLCHAQNLDAVLKAELFVGGLPDHIRVDVELWAPQDLPTAMHLARAFELRASAVASLRPPELPHQALQQRFQQASAARPTLPPPAGTPAGGAPQAPAAAVPPPPIRQFRRLSPAEQLERRRQGLWYNCNEPFVRGHQCKRLFYLESDNYTDDDTPPDHEATAEDTGALDASANALVVSPHAVAGLQTENSMVIYITIKGERLLALLDMGSTHNFIQGATL
jgi:hypothetical protein